MKAILITSIQFICIFWILFTNSWLATEPFLIAVQLTGFALGLWAIFVMSRSKLNITPVPLKGAFLITNGPYRLIRHPMYTSVILILFPILVGNYSWTNILVFGILLINMIVKLHFEEKLLLAKFPDYKEVISNTWRLVPWIY